MNRASVQEMIAVLAEAEQKMLELGGSLIDLSQASFADRAALIAQTAQFNSVAARWQAETQALVAVLAEFARDSDTPSGLTPPPIAPGIPTQPIAQPPSKPSTDVPHIPAGRRLTLADNWTNHRPYVFCLEPEVYHQTRSFREIYTTTLTIFSEKYGADFISRVLAHKAQAPIALQKEPNTYTTLFLSLQGYAFNVNLSADSLQAAIRFLYGAFGLNPNDFSCWEKGPADDGVTVV
jgi:hypothetical protein